MSTPKVSTKLPAKSRLGSWPVPLLWLALLTLSVSIFAGWSALGLPAALLLGPMIGAIVLGVNGAKIQVPRIPFLGAQALIAAMVAQSITRSILVTFSHQYWLFCTVILGTLLGVWAAGNLARPVEGDWHRRRSAWVIISADRQKRDQCLVSHPGNHSSRCIRFRFIAAHIRRHSAFTAHNPRRLKDLNPSTCLIQPNTGSGMVLRRR